MEGKLYGKCFGVRCVLVALALCFGVGGVSAQAVDPPAIEKGQFLPIPALQTTPVAPARGAKGLAVPSTVSNEVLLYSEDFEAGAPGSTTNGSWGIGGPTSGPFSGFLSGSAAATNLAGDYGNSANDLLTLPALALPNVVGDVVLRFDEWVELESGFDNGTVEVSTDGGANWVQVDSRSGVSNWRQRSVSLNAYIGQTVLIGFRLTSDGSVVNAGWYVDNVRVVRDLPDPIEVQIPSINSQAFPFIFMDVTVDDRVGDCPAELDASHFLVEENSLPQADFFTVVPPSQGGGSRLADIVFLIDNSGSMGGEQRQVIDNIEDFVDALVLDGVDVSLCLTRYGQSSGSGAPFLEDAGSCTTDVAYFKNSVLPRNVTSGGTEPGYRAITESASGVVFRPGARRIFIEITDETPAQGSITLADADAALRAGSITLFALTKSNLFQTFEPLVADPAIQLYDILDPFDGILTVITGLISDAYRVSYRSSNDTLDGSIRSVTTTVSCGASTGLAETSYQVGAAQTIERSAATIALGNSPQLENLALNIEVFVEDTVAPFLQGVTLFYKPTSGSGFDSVAMIPGANANSYVAQIPAGSVLDPGVEYYVTATDGVSTTSLPSANPASTPFQIAVLPNEAPVITHSPVTSSPFGANVTVSAVVTDSTTQVADVTLFYRSFGALLYTALPMGSTGASAFSAVIPGSAMVFPGLEYYVRARDDFGVSSTVGTADAPLFVAAEVPAAAAPVLISPAGGVSISDSRPIYKWNASLGASWYQLWVEDSTGERIKEWYEAGEVGCSSSTGTCSVRPLTEVKGSSRWWVQAWNEQGSAWSDSANFVVNGSAPAVAAALVSPSGSIPRTLATYSWGAVANATWYYLWVTDSTGVAIKQWYSADELGCSNGTGICSITPATEIKGDVRWWVRTWNIYGVGPWSSSLQFSEPGGIPGVVGLQSPSGTSAAFPVFRWNSELRATWYQLIASDEQGNRISQWYSAQDAGCAEGIGGCSVTPRTGLQGSSQWWVRGWNTYGNGPWSSALNFTPASP